MLVVKEMKTKAAVAFMVPSKELNEYLVAEGMIRTWKVFVQDKLNIVISTATSCFRGLFHMRA